MYVYVYMCIYILYIYTHIYLYLHCAAEMSDADSRAIHPIGPRHSQLQRPRIEQRRAHKLQVQSRERHLQGRGERGGAEWVRARVDSSMCFFYIYIYVYLSLCLYIHVYIYLYNHMSISVSYELLVDASEDGVVEVPGLVQRRLCHTPTTHGQRPK
jgi:hypothetical protein